MMNTILKPGVLGTNFKFSQFIHSSSVVILPVQLLGVCRVASRVNVTSLITNSCYKARFIIICRTIYHC